MKEMRRLRQELKHHFQMLTFGGEGRPAVQIAAAGALRDLRGREDPHRERLPRLPSPRCAALRGAATVALCRGSERGSRSFFSAVESPSFRGTALLPAETCGILSDGCAQKEKTDAI